MRDHVHANPTTVTEILGMFGNDAEEFDSFDAWYNAQTEDDSNAAIVTLWRRGVCTLLMSLAMHLNITLVTTRYFQVGASPHWERFSSESSDGSTLWDSTEIWVTPRAPGRPSAPVVVIGSFCHPNATDCHHYSTVNVASSDRQIRHAKIVRDEIADEYSTRKV